MRDLYIFDLDGTLADCRQRLHHIEGQKKDWDAFFKDCINDTPNNWVADLARGLDLAGHILILTGRTVTYEAQTLSWLRKHKIPHDWIVMRGAQDFRPDVIAKPELLSKFLAHTHDRVRFIVEDRAGMVEMWRDLGYNVLDVGPTAYIEHIAERIERKEHVRRTRKKVST